MRREVQVLQGRRREGKEGIAVLSMRLESDDCNHSFLCTDKKMTFALLTCFYYS
jgi:hypothetical protein